MFFNIRKIWLILITISISQLLLAEATDESLSQLNNQLLTFKNDITQLQSSKTTLSEQDSHRLEDLKKASDFISETLNLDKQLKELELQNQVAPKKTLALDEAISSFIEHKFDSSLLENQSTDELNQQLSKKKEQYTQLKKTYSQLNSEILESKTQRDASQEYILKNVERLTWINSQKSAPLSKDKTSSQARFFEAKKIELENTYLRKQQSSFLVLNKLRTTKKNSPRKTNPQF